MINPQPRFFQRIPLLVFFVAGLLGLLKAAPLARAQFITPPGWHFSGILSNSPDLMQYRVWMRQALDEGPLLTNKFTAEPNRPHMLMLHYAFLGKTAQILGVAPEFVYSYSGVLLTFLFVIFFYCVVRRFIGDRRQTWWIFGVSLLAGGLETHLGILSNLSVVRNNPLLMNTLIQGFWNHKSFTDYRGNFLFNAMLDSHYILNWLILLAAVMAVYFALQHFSRGRLLLAIGLAAGCTLLHLYEGITLLAIVGSLAGLLWLKKRLGRKEVVTLASVGGAVLITLAALFLLQSRSGLPMPDWSEEPILFSTLILAFPLVWLLFLFGFARYWKEATLNEIFLTGWAAGCLVLCLAGPYYPYPNRGAITLQIPLYLIAGQIFFKRWPRMTWWALALTVVMILPMPLVQLKDQIDRSGFNSARPAVFLDPAHQELSEALNRAAAPQDLLLANMDVPEWNGDLLWLGPEYPGRFYCGHFFLCPGFKQKRLDIIDFYQAGPAEQAAFLRKNQIRFVFARPDQAPNHFSEISGMATLAQNQAGTIYEFSP